MEFNLLDWIILAVCAGGLILGYIRGFINQLVSLAGLFVSFIAAFLFYDKLAPWLAKMFPISSWEAYSQYQFILETLNVDTYFYNAVAFAVLFFGAKIILSIVGHFLNLFSKMPGLNLINKWSGALLGLIEAVLLVVVAVHVMGVMPSQSVQELVDGSTIAHWIHERIAEWMASSTA